MIKERNKSNKLSEKTITIKTTSNSPIITNNKIRLYILDMDLLFSSLFIESSVSKTSFTKL